jgi:NADH-quinone oxidoreductase subunit N
MAYSSIAHGGYLLIGLAAASAATATGQPAAGGAAAMCFYLLVYALASMGVFVALAYLSSARREVNDVEELAGLARGEPLVAAALAVCLLSLAGLPPLAGFWGKLQLFSSAVQLAVAPAGGGVPLWFLALAVIGALNAAIAAAYYLRIVGAMYFQPAVQPLAPAGGPAARVAALLLAAAVLAAGVLPGRLVETSRRAGQALAEVELLAPAAAVFPRPPASMPQTRHAKPHRGQQLVQHGAASAR